MADIDPDIQAAFSNAPQAPAPAASVDSDIAAAFNQSPAAPKAAPIQTASIPGEDMAEIYGSEAGPGFLLENPNFWRGLGRGALGTYLSATATNPQAAERETEDYAHRWGLDQGQNTAEGLAGRTFGGFLAPLPGGLEGEAVPNAAMRDASTARPGLGINNPQSISAAASGPNLSQASPELRAAAQEAQAKGTFNQGAFDRQLEAESLPVPANLTKGQATQDPVLISTEKNLRGKNPEFATRFNEQNQNLIDNMDHLREEVGPNVFSANEVDHGRTMIKAYQDMDAAANADISAKYQALRDANGGQFPVDGATLQSNVDSALHSKLLYEHAPSAEMSQLASAAKNGMTFEQYEAMRTNLARIMRSSSDGNEVAAAGIIRNEMEKLPLSGDAATLKPLADAARSAAKARFDAINADPAYKAVVNGKVAPDDFVQRFIVNGNVDDVAKMKANFSGNETAQETMGVAALDHLRQRATNGGPTLRQSGYNRALQNLEPKLGSLFNPQQRQTLESIGNVARNQQVQPAGSFVNNSNTTVAAHASGMVKNAAEAAVNAKTLGFGGTLGRKLLEGRAAKKLLEEHLAPGAGVDFSPGNP